MSGNDLNTQDFQRVFAGMMRSYGKNPVSTTLITHKVLKSILHIITIFAWEAHVDINFINMIFKDSIDEQTAKKYFIIYQVLQRSNKFVGKYDDVVELAKRVIMYYCFLIEENRIDDKMEKLNKKCQEGCIPEQTYIDIMNTLQIQYDEYDCMYRLMDWDNIHTLDTFIPIEEGGDGIILYNL